jgi:hypothetical protein
LSPSSAKIPADLIPASRNQDHAISPPQVTSLVLRRYRVHRIPRSTFVTMRNAPLVSAGRDWLYCCFYRNEKQNIFCKGAGQEFADLPVGHLPGVRPNIGC